MTQIPLMGSVCQVGNCSGEAEAWVSAAGGRVRLQVCREHSDQLQGKGYGWSPDNQSPGRPEP